jgi:hypothetical protein
MLGNVLPSFFELWQTEIEMSFECVHTYIGMQTICMSHRTILNNIKERSNLFCNSMEYDR